MNNMTEAKMYALIASISSDTDRGTIEQIECIIVKAAQDAMEKRREYFQRKNEAA